MSHVVDVGSWPSQLAASQDSALLSKQDVHVRLSSEHAVAAEGSNGGKDREDGTVAGAVGAPIIDGIEGSDGKIAGPEGPTSDGIWPRATGFGKTRNNNVSKRMDSMKS